MMTPTSRFGLAVLPLLVVGCQNQEGTYPSDPTPSGYVLVDAKTTKVSTSSSPRLPIDSARGVIIFVHGVTGGTLSTWWNSKAEKSFAGMVATDQTYSGYNVYAYGYDSKYVGQSPKIDQIASDMGQELTARGVLKHKEIILVAHSMGGLVTRSFLIQYHTLPNHRIRFLALYSTPSGGSFLSNIAKRVSFNPQFKQMSKMLPENYIGELLLQWLQHERMPIPTYCLCEDEDTFTARVVPFDSAVHLCTRPIERIEADHIQIVKPAHERQLAYTFLKRAFLETEPRPPEPEAKRLPKDLSVDLSRDIYFEINLYGGDRVEPVDWPDDVEWVRYQGEGGIKCIGIRGGAFTVEAPPGEPVLPEFVAQCAGPARAVRADGSNTVRLRVTPGSSFDRPRDLTSEPPVLRPQEASTQAAEVVPTRHADSLDLCDELRSHTRQVECRKTVRGYRLEPAATFAGGKWQDSSIETALEVIADVMAEVRVTGKATVHGFASRAHFACSALAKVTAGRLGDNPWLTPGAESMTFRLSRPQGDPAEELVCADQPVGSQKEGNFLLSLARAAWAAEVLSRKGVAVSGVRAASARYALYGNNPLDRRIQVDLALTP